MSYFQNSQWIVTENGMETIGSGVPQYIILGARLFERQDELYEWPIHLAEKTWVDLAAFEEAFRSALAAHSAKLNAPIDEAALDRSFVRAHDRKRGAK